MKKIVAWLSLSVLVKMLVLTIGMYKYAISLVAKMPEKAGHELTKTQVEELWQSKEKCSPYKCASTTPYWIYRWLIAALINDYIVKVSVDSLNDNLSIMTSQIALQHMRQGNFKGKGMLMWHLTHVYLSIWLQKNWTAAEITEKYVANNALPGVAVEGIRSTPSCTMCWAHLIVQAGTSFLPPLNLALRGE